MSFLEYFQKLLSPEDLKKLTASYQKPLTPSLRVNTLKIPPTEFLKNNWSLEPVPWCPEGFFCAQSLGNTIEHKTGLFYLQEASAMLPVEVLKPEPDDKILDLCAAPGGKTTQLAAKMANTGLIIANEVVPKRTQSLKLNLNRIGVQNAVITSLDSSFFAQNLPNYFDKILVDAPCSGEGMTDIMQNIEKTWNFNKVKFNAQRQKRLLKNAFLSLKEKGTLVYSTCTLNLEENEKVIDDLLKNLPEADLEPITQIEPNGFTDNLNPRLKKTVRIWPFDFHTGGFFIAKIIKKSPTHQKPSPENHFNLTLLNKNEQAQIKSIFKKHFGYHLEIPQDKILTRQYDKIYLSPDKIQKLNLPKIISPGLPLLTLYPNNDFRISYAAALTFGQNFTKNKIELTTEQTEKYLNREDITGEWPTQGQVILTHQNLPLGPGKIIAEKLKNWL